MTVSSRADNHTPQAATRLEILAWNPQELAEQITIIDSTMLLSIKTSELYKLAWRNDSTKKKVAPNILGMVERFNMVGYALT